MVAQVTKTHLRLVFTSDGVTVLIVSIEGYDLLKIKKKKKQS